MNLIEEAAKRLAELERAGIEPPKIAEPTLTRRAEKIDTPDVRLPRDPQVAKRPADELRSDNNVDFELSSIPRPPSSSTSGYWGAPSRIASLTASRCPMARCDFTFCAILHARTTQSFRPSTSAIAPRRFPRCRQQGAG